MNSPFLFTTCQLGAEPALKSEIAREHPEFRFAFSRPGFLTFKNVSGFVAPDFQLNSVFARTYGVSIGTVNAAEAEGSAVSEILKLAAPLMTAKTLRLHVWERDQFSVGEEPPKFHKGARARVLEKELRAGESQWLSGTRAESGDWVLDVIVVEDQKFWVGFHEASFAHSPFPGSDPEIVVPAEAPSRAYLKLEQGLAWSGCPMTSGDLAVEIGSAPGGASFALLKRGVSVIGIDPGMMAPQVLSFRESPRFSHLCKSVVRIEKDDLPQGVKWLLLDMNTEPDVSLAALERIFPMIQESLMGMLLTIKLNDWDFAREIPAFLERIRSLGCPRIRATQLPGNKQEIFVYALTRRGQTLGPKRR